MIDESAEIKALTFDVGGTVVDWYGGMMEQLKRFGRENGIDVDWDAFLTQWRIKSVGTALNSNTADLPEGTLDGVHRHVLEDVLTEFDVSELTEEDKVEMTTLWHNIPPLPEAPEGHSRLRENFILSTTTILSVPMVVGISRNAPFHWDCVISCSMLEEYKFRPSAYHRSAELLGVDTEEMLFVSTSTVDLQAAENAGMRTALLDWPGEWGFEASPSSIDLIEALRMEMGADFDDLVKQSQEFSPDFRASGLKQLSNKIEVHSPD